MTYSEIRPLFENHYNYNQAFLEEVNEEVTVPEKEVEVEGHKREGESLEKEITKKQKINEEEEELKSHLQIVSNNDDDPDVEASVWRDQKSRYGLAKRYPLTHFTLEQMLNNVKLEVKEESEMSLELLRSSIIVFSFLSIVPNMSSSAISVPFSSAVSSKMPYFMAIEAFHFDTNATFCVFDDDAVVPLTSRLSTLRLLYRSSKLRVKENQEKNKIGSKPDKNRKRGEAGKSLKQLQWVEQEKLSKTQKEWPETQIRPGARGNTSSPESSGSSLITRLRVRPVPSRFLLFVFREMVVGNYWIVVEKYWYTPSVVEVGILKRAIGYNPSFNALIPKIPDANKGFGDIVNEVQSDFIAERQILDGPFILNEVLQWCKFKKKQSLIFKVDFEKAGGAEQEQLDALMDLVSTVNLVSMGDRWVWTLESSEEFSVASLRKVIEESSERLL
nr:RNA-directed DNA polymerase, eukaryota, reverse transcriptase zinc-binding domain protein [Tanacetum cinerariifolium]